MSIKKTRFHISGMHCVSCAASIEKALKKVPGMKKVAVNYIQEDAQIEFDETQCTPQMICEAVENAGYKAIELEESEEIQNLEKQKELIQLKRELFISIVCTVFIVIGTMIPFAPDIFRNKWLLWFFATPIQLWVGLRFYKTAWYAFKQHTANMYTLITLGTSVAYGYSVIVIFFEPLFKKAGIETHLYFDASAVIITLIILGQYLETRAKGAASQAIKKLLNLQPELATVLKNQEWIETSIQNIAIGDIILIKPGDKIPVDGEIIQGESLIDQSMVTGESIPAQKKLGDAVFGATINKTGSFQMKATKVGSETLLARIVQLVRQAQQSKPAIARIVDQIATIFVPVVMILAVVTYLIWFNLGPEPQYLFALVAMISVLIIACPCALGLATPTSIMVGIERAARESILIKDVQTLETGGKVTVVVVDKTGTLTQGTPEVVNLAFVSNLQEQKVKFNLKGENLDELQKYVMGMAQSLEQLSRHPISQAFVNHFKHDFPSFAVEQFASIEGFGIKGTIDNRRVIVGSKKLMEKEQVQRNAQLEEYALDWSNEAQTISYVAVDGHILALVGVADVIRKDAHAMINELKKMGINVVMLTGDNKKTAEAIAKKLGIRDYVAEILPDAKKEYITKLCEANMVAMVGDGINDAPALAAANVGIAMAGGTDIAIETAAVILLKDDLLCVPRLIKLSQATIRNIKQNLVWAFGYNILLVPVAMGILYPFFGILLNPMIAGGAMAFSSLSVVLNALRLVRVKL